MIAVYKRELYSLMRSMIVWIYLAVFALFTAVFAAVFSFYGGYSSIESIFPYLVLVVLVAIPILTMKTLSEERKNKTDLLLSSLPISSADYVIGKYLSLLTLNALCSAYLCIFPVVFSFYAITEVNFALSYISIFTFFLCTSGLMAIGLLMSSFAESPIISALLSYAAMFAIYFMPIISVLIPSDALSSLIAISVVLALLSIAFYILSKKVFISILIFAIPELVLVLIYFIKGALLEGALTRICAALSLTDRLDILVISGILDLSTIVYYITTTVLFVFFTCRSADSRRYI